MSEEYDDSDAQEAAEHQQQLDERRRSEELSLQFRAECLDFENYQRRWEERMAPYWHALSRELGW